MQRAPFHKLKIRKWLQRHSASIKNKPIILFTVSGALAGPKLDAWIADSLPGDLILQMEHVALRGRLDHKEISWWVKLILRIGAWKNDDAEAKEQELKGFDFMDKSSIEPIKRLVQKIQSRAS